MNGHLLPRRFTPHLAVETLDNGSWTLTEQRPERFTLLVFYRGLHCPICRTYITELDQQFSQFTQRGVGVLAISCDSKKSAITSKENWGLRNVPIGYGLDLKIAREWGLYISASKGTTSIGIEEPLHFSEPGLFLVRPDRTLYWSAVQTMPFARPHMKEILAGLDFVIKFNYPARGDVEL